VISGKKVLVPIDKHFHQWLAFEELNVRCTANPTVHISVGVIGVRAKLDTYLSLMWKLTSRRYSSFVFRFDKRFCAIAMY